MGLEIIGTFPSICIILLDDEDDDGDGISDKNDKDDDGDGVDDSTGQSYKSGKPEAVSKEKSGAVEGMVFAYFFGLASMLLKNV